MWDLIPELVDHIFEFLEDHDLYNCLFVSHDFNAHASRLLYREIDFNAGFTARYSDEEHKTQCYRKQGSLWESLTRRPALARHIYYLKINPLHEEEGEMFPPFLERVSYIIHNASSLRHMNYIAIDRDHSSDYSVELFRTIITALESTEIKPELSIKSRRPIVGKPFGESLAYIRNKFPVTDLDVLSEGTQDDILLLFLAQFPQLQQLAVWYFGLRDIAPQDMDSALQHLPLKELTIYESERFVSFPRQLQTLDIQLDRWELTDSIWTAARTLRHLSDLNIECGDIEEREDEQPLTFSSLNLRSVFLRLSARTEEIIERQIIQPIFTGSPHLTYVELYVNTSFSSNPLALVLSIETLVDVQITSPASPYTFLDLASLPKTLPNLEALRLPWPATIGIPLNDGAGTSTDWRYKQDHSQDVADRLSLDLCQRFAAKYPKLEDIVFDIDIAGKAGNELFEWIKSESSNSVSYPDPLDSSRI